MGFIEDGKWRSRYYSRVWYGGHFLALHFKVKRFTVHKSKNLCLGLDLSIPQSSIHLICIGCELLSNSLYVAQPSRGGSSRDGSIRRSWLIGKGPCNRNLHPCSASCRASVLYEIASARSANSCRWLDDRGCLGMLSKKGKGKRNLQRWLLYLTAIYSWP